MFRRLCTCCAKPLTDADRKLWVTEYIDRQVRRFRLVILHRHSRVHILHHAAEQTKRPSCLGQARAVWRWDRSSVLIKAIWLSLVYWIWSVAFGRLVTLFLIWLRKELLSVRSVATAHAWPAFFSLSLSERTGPASSACTWRSVLRAGVLQPAHDNSGLHCFRLDNVCEWAMDSSSIALCVL